MAKDLLDGLGTEQKVALAQELRELRLLHSDRTVAATIEQEAQFMRDGLPRLKKIDPGLAETVQLELDQTLKARAVIDSENGIVEKIGSAMTGLGPDNPDTVKFMALLRRAEKGDAEAMTTIDRARSDLLAAEAEAGVGPLKASPSDLRPNRHLAGLPVLELAATMADENVGMRLQGPAEHLRTAKEARKAAEFDAMRAQQQTQEQEAQRDRDREVEAAKSKEAAAREAQQNEVEAKASSAKVKSDPNALPDHFLGRYEKKGNKLVRVGEEAGQALLRDNGQKLTTDKEFNSETVLAMVEIAQARGWTSLTVNGSKEFRRAVWAEAASRGLDVQGYEPTQGEQARVDKDLARTQNAVKETDSVKAFKDANTPQARQEAIDKHPELKPAFKLAAAAQAFANERMPQQSQAAFMQRMRHNIALDLAQGRMLATIDLVYPPNAAKEQQQPQRDAGRER